MTQTETKGYNGWKNYETWAVKLWMDNEEDTYNYWRETVAEQWENNSDTTPDYLTRSEHARMMLADALEQSHEDDAPELTGVYADLLAAALSEVDWFEIADALLTDAELDGYETRS